MADTNYKDIKTKTLLYVPEVSEEQEKTLFLPSPPSDPSKPTPSRTNTRVLQRFAEAVLKSNLHAVTGTSGYIRLSFRTLYAMYLILFAIGVVGTVLALARGFTASSGEQVAGTLTIAGFSIASFATLFLTRPLESLERNTIYQAWLTSVMNAYWSRLMYMNDPKTIDTDLLSATNDLIDELTKLADRHSTAIGKYGGTADGDTADRTKQTHTGVFQNREGVKVNDLHVEFDVEGVEVDESKFPNTSTDGKKVDLKGRDVLDKSLAKVKFKKDSGDFKVEKWWWTVDNVKQGDEKSGPPTNEDGDPLWT